MFKGSLGSLSGAHKAMNLKTRATPEMIRRGSLHLRINCAWKYVAACWGCTIGYMGLLVVYMCLSVNTVAVATAMRLDGYLSVA